MSPSIIAYTTDLIFATRIRSTAESLGRRIRMVRSPESLPDSLRDTSAGLILIDLNAEGNPLEVIRIARQTSPNAHLVTFCSHVQRELAEKAKEAGAHEVLTRSAFTARLPEILGAADIS